MQIKVDKKVTGTRFELSHISLLEQETPLLKKKKQKGKKKSSIFFELPSTLQYTNIIIKNLLRVM